MELALYSMWSIDIRNLVKNEIFLVREYHLQPTEVHQMPMYLYEMWLEEINIIQKKEEEQREKEEKQQKANMPKMPNLNSFKSNFSAPKMPTINMPKF